MKIYQCPGVVPEGGTVAAGIDWCISFRSL
jgi:hypothetical protein